MLTVPNLNPSISFIANDKPTRELVARLVALTDRRAKVSQEAVASMICSILSLRGCSFNVFVANFTTEQKAAFAQIKRYLMPDLVIRSTAKTYQVKPNLQPTMVISDMPSNIGFHCAGQYQRFTASEAIPCADLVGTLSGQRAVKLTLPDLALAFQYQIDGIRYPTHIHRLDPLDSTSAGEHFAKDYIQEVKRVLRRSKYLAVVVDGNDPKQLTLVVTNTHAGQFTSDVEAMTRLWFKQMKFDHLKFYAQGEDRYGAVATFSGSPTLQLLRTQAGLTDAA